MLRHHRQQDACVRPQENSVVLYYASNDFVTCLMSFLYSVTRPCLTSWYCIAPFLSPLFYFYLLQTLFTVFDRTCGQWRVDVLNFTRALFDMKPTCLKAAVFLFI